MPSTRLILIGLEDGRKHTISWTKGGELSGDADLQTRFRQAWEAAGHEAFRLSLDKQVRAHFRSYLAEKVLRQLCGETLDLELARVSTPEELQQTAEAWNAHSKSRGEGCPHTAEEVRRREADDCHAQHCSPPYCWDEIETALAEVPDPSMPFPEDTPRCLDCLSPMEWVCFASHPDTWEMECGRAGWTPICRACRTWRACRVVVMN